MGGEKVREREERGRERIQKILKIDRVSHVHLVRC